MKKLILLCFFGTSLWVCAVSANVNVIADRVPTIKIGADGSLPQDGSQCVRVDDDGVARVDFAFPPHIKNQKEGGFDYDRYGFYFSLMAANHGSFPTQSSVASPEAIIYQEVISSKNAGKTICFTLDANMDVPSYFETVARYFGLIGALRMLESAAGATYQDFPSTSYPGSIPAITMLHNQLEMGKDLRQLTMLKANTSSATAGFVTGGLLSTGYLFFPESWYTPITELGTTGSFTLFYSAPIGDGLLIGIDDSVATPIGELISPANGTQRQPGSLMASHAFRGPVMLGSLYGTQNYWTGEHASKPVNTLMVSLTIVTTYSTRTFIRELGKNFLDDGELLGYLHDGFLMMSIASIDDPSNVIAIYRDESFKDRTNDLLNTYQHYSDQMKAVDKFFVKNLYRLEQTLIWAPIVLGLMTAYSATVPLVNSILSHAETPLPLVVMVGMQKANSVKKAISNGLTKTRQVVASLPGISHVAKSLPQPARSGIPFDTKTNAGKAMGLSFSFNVAGPGFRTMVHGLSNLMTDLGDPGSPWHTTFQTGRQFVIGHYVMP